MDNSQDKFLFIHLSFHYYHLHPPYSRQEYPTHANGFMNQIQSLLNAIQISRLTGRQLVVDGFHIDVTDKYRKIPLSSVVDISSLDIACTDIDIFPHRDKFVVSSYAHQMIHRSKDEWLQDIITREDHIQYLETDCTFYFCFCRSTYQNHLRNLRFNSLFYELTDRYLETFGHEHLFDIVHYRMEDDFSAYFATLMKPPVSSLHLKNRLFHTYQHYFNTLTSTNSILFVSGYFKLQNNNEYIPEKVHIHEFRPTTNDMKRIQEHCGLTDDEIHHQKYREISAMMDFIIATGKRVISFLGISESSFSQAVYEYHLQMKREGKIRLKLFHLGILDASPFADNEDLISVNV